MEEWTQTYMWQQQGSQIHFGLMILQLESFVDDGVGVGTNTDGCELVLHHDLWSGRYFESLTDADI